MNKKLWCFLMFCILVTSIKGYAQESKNLKLLFMGDVMQHGQQVKSAFDKKTKTYNFHHNYKYVKPIISSADIAIANLELTLAGPPYKGYPQFSAPDDIAVALKDAGVDILVTANNHSLDRHKKGLERTINVLDSLKIPHTGTFKDSLSRANTYPLIFEKNGYKIALLNYTYGTNGIRVRAPNIVNYIDNSLILDDIKAAKSKNPDLIIVFTHWGFEYKKLPNQAQKQLTELCFKNGVQLVIGSHPHVLQPIEFRSDTTLVAYSLGNYISNMRKRYMDGGMMLEVELQKDSTGVTIKNAGYHLGWVYTTPEPAHQFYILPTSAYEYDSTFVLEEDSRTRMKTFATDSRNLLITNNINVNEIKVFPQLVRIDSVFGFNGNRFKKSILVPEVKSILESETKSTHKKIIAKDQVPAVKKNNLQRFRVQIMVTSSDIKPEHIPHQYNKSVFKEEVKGLFKYQIGEWSSRNEAEGHLKIIRSITGYEDAFIVIHK